MSSISLLILCLLLSNGLWVVAYFSKKKRLLSQKTEINRTHQRLDSIYRAAPVGVGLLTNRVFKDVNPLFEEITGYSSEEAVGKKARFLYETEDEFVRAGEEKYRQIAKCGTGTVETQWKRKDGKIVDIMLSSTPIDLNDLSKGVVFTALDISERKELERKILETEERFRLAMDATQDGIWDWDLISEFVYYSPGWASMLGYEPGELKTKLSTWENLTHPEDRDATFELFDQYKNGEIDKFEIELRMNHKNGSWVEVLSRAKGVFDADGTLLRLIGTHLNITPLRDVERELQDRERKLRNAQSFAGLGSWSLNLGNNDIFWNDEMFRIFGRNKDELSQISENWTNDIYPSDRKRVLSQFEAGLEKGEGYELDFRMVRSSDGDVRLLSGKTGFRKEENKVVEAYGVLMDITDRKASESVINAFFEQPMNLHMVATLEGQIVKVNRGWEAHCGFSPNEVVGTKFFDYIHSDDLVNTEKEFASLLKGKGSFYFENRYRHKNGSYRLLAWSAIASISDERVYAIAQDITEKAKLEKDLRVVEDRYVGALEGAADGIWYWSPVTNETYFSKGWKSMLGYKEDELENEFGVWKTLVHGDDIDFAISRVNDLLEGRSDRYEAEFRMQHKKGHYIWVLAKGTATKDEAGKIVDITGTHVDFTRQKNAERKLIDSQQRFQMAFMNHPTAMSIAKLDTGKRIFVNESFVALTGYSLDVLLKEPISEMSCWKDGKQLGEMLSDLKSTGFVRDRFAHIEDAKGIERDVIVNMSLLEEGKDQLILTSIYDVTAEKIAQKESQQSRQRLELALQIGNISICEWIPSEDFFYSDGKLEEFLGYDQENVIYGIKSIKEKWSILVDDDDQHKIDLLDNLKEGESNSVCDCTLRMHQLNGELKWIRAIVKATDFDEEGLPTRYLGIHVDVDQEKRQEHEALEHREKVMKADKLSTLGTLAAGVAHEINNPNQFILSNISLLEATWVEIREILDQWVEDQGELEIAGFEYDELRERYPRALESMKSGSRRIKSIVKELKDYVRENRSEGFSQVDVNKIIYSAQILTANLGKKKTDSFNWETNGQLYVRGNNQKLEQVFVNLIINAFEALTDKTDSVTVKSYLNEQNEVVVDVIDEGVGIPGELMEKIRDPFFTTKQSEGGTGMGLSVVDSIVKEHGGRMEFIPNEEKGTCVRVVLTQSE